MLTAEAVLCHLCAWPLRGAECRNANQNSVVYPDTPRLQSRAASFRSLPAAAAAQSGPCATEITVTLTFCFWKFFSVKNTEKKQFRQNYIFSNFNIDKMFHFVNVKVKT